MDFKLWVLQGHYQSERNFTFEDLAAAKSRRLAWRNRIARAYQENAKGTRQGSLEPMAFEDSSDSEQSGFNPLADLNDNLNSATAFASIDSHDLSLRDWQLVDQLFGLNLLQDSPRITPELAELIDQRGLARKNKDYATADQLRDRLTEANFTVLDTPEGPVWQYLS